MRFAFHLVALLTSTISVLAVDTPPNLSWKITRYEREIDFTNTYPVEISILSITNTSPDPQNKYDFLLNLPHNVPSPASVDVSTGKSKIPYEVLAPNRIRVLFPAAIAPNSPIKFAVRYLYVAPLEPVPATIALSDQQFLVWSGNKLPELLYPIELYQLLFIGIAQGLELKVDEPILERVTELLKDFIPRVDGRRLIYGPLQGPIPQLSAPMLLRFDHPAPLAHVHSLNRSVWIPASSLAKVVIEEDYDLAHVGAGLTNGFSRLEWMTGRYPQKKAHWLLVWLDFEPLEGGLSWDEASFYHSDLVGKVSTPKTYQKHLVVQPRYPMFGGWHYNFTLSYEAGLASMLHRVTDGDVSDTYIARAPIVNTVSGLTYGTARLAFYLPEGSTLLNVSCNAYGLTPTVETDTEKSFWDVGAGHTKVVVTLKNITSELAKDFVYVKYQYTTAAYLRKMVVIGMSVFVALAAYYVLGKISLDIEAKK